MLFNLGILLDIIFLQQKLKVFENSPIIIFAGKGAKTYGRVCILVKAAETSFGLGRSGITQFTLVSCVL